MSMTLDGFVADQNGKMDWIFSSSTQTTRDYIDDLLNKADHILLGRGMSAGFLDYWPTDKTEFGAKINRLPSTVFSKTLDKVEWPNVTVAKDIASEIARLKSEPGKNLILYGGASLVQSFINLNLIDEYHLLVGPLILGKGLSLFANIQSERKLNLVKTTTSETGVVVFHYEPKRD
jgi:dihydrofolate reductase